MDAIAAGTSEILNPEEYEGKHNQESVMTRSTDASRMKAQRVKARQLGMDGGAANYYKSVRVCATCYRVYSTLDAARELLQYQQEETAALGRSSHTRRRLGGSSVLTEGDGRSPLLEDVTAFESDVRSKAHTFGASRQSMSRATQRKAAAAHRRREREKLAEHSQSQRLQQNHGDKGGVGAPCSCQTFTDHRHQWEWRRWLRYVCRMDKSPTPS